MFFVQINCYFACIVIRSRPKHSWSSELETKTVASFYRKSELTEEVSLCVLEFFEKGYTDLFFNFLSLNKLLLFYHKNMIWWVYCILFFYLFTFLEPYNFCSKINMINHWSTSIKLSITKSLDGIKWAIWVV